MTRLPARNYEGTYKDGEKIGGYFLFTHGGSAGQIKGDTEKDSLFPK